jgi:hypothetical protein
MMTNNNNNNNKKSRKEMNERENEIIQEKENLKLGMSCRNFYV